MKSYTRSLRLVGQALPQIAPRYDLTHLKLRLKVLVAGLSHRRQLLAITAASSPSLQRIAAERPQMLVGPLVWPFLCASWDVPHRLERILAHYRALDCLGPPFPFGTQEKLVLADLDHVHPDLRITLDQPPWFMREGGLTLNLFVGDFRAYSLAFALSLSEQGRMDCLIGAIQGRDTDGALDLYRDLTKNMHGLRPRDFLIEICRMLCRHWRVRYLLGIRDSQRHHRHAFFKGQKVTLQDYDAVWQDRGGMPDDANFYRLPITPDRRPIEDIKPNKRSLYRRRYLLLDEIEADILACLPRLEPVRLVDLDR